MLSGALFPCKEPPLLVVGFVAVNPVSYAVDALRTVILGSTSGFGLLADFGVLIAFAIVMVAIGTYAFRKMKF